MALGGLNGSMGIMARREQTITEVTIDDVEIRVGDGRDVLRRPPRSDTTSHQNEMTGVTLNTFVLPHSSCSHRMPIELKTWVQDKCVSITPSTNFGMKSSGTGTSCDSTIFLSILQFNIIGEWAEMR